MNIVSLLMYFLTEYNLSYIYSLHVTGWFTEMYYLFLLFTVQFLFQMWGLVTEMSNPSLLGCAFFHFTREGWVTEMSCPSHVHFFKYLLDLCRNALSNYGLLYIVKFVYQMLALFQNIKWFCFQWGDLLQKCLIYLL